MTDIWLTKKKLEQVELKHVEVGSINSISRRSAIYMLRNLDEEFLKWELNINFNKTKCGTIKELQL